MNVREDYVFFPVPRVASASLNTALGYSTGGNIPIKVSSAPPKIYNHHYTIAFVRNPWGKAVSEWKYFNKVVNLNLTFKESLSRRYPFKDHELQQIIFTQGCDFIGRFENLQEDFNIICDKIGIPHQQLPRKNATNHKHYTEYYDNETRSIVAQKYARDIEHFGYKFGE